MYNIKKVKWDSKVLVVSKNNKTTRVVMVETYKDLFNRKLDFDRFYKLQVGVIKQSTISEIIKIRKDYVKELSSLNFILKKNNLSEGMRKFLKGKRKFVVRLLGYSKRRIKAVNRIVDSKKWKKRGLL